MLDLVDVGERSLESYRGIVDDSLLEQVHRVARHLHGARVLHLNATPYGGGVSELLRSTVPLLNDLGMLADWRIISGDEAFFRVTKTIHNGLQGAPRALTGDEKATYLASSRTNAAAFSEQYDFIFVHDPQPAALLTLRGKGDARWIWRCHVDTGSANPEVWDFLRPFLADFDAAVFTMQQFVPPGLPIRRVEIMPPAIDPLSPKNMPLPEATARQILEWNGVSTRRPLITQVSRFDRWKDPMGVVAAYRLARQRFPQLQLAMVGSLALDDPEGAELYRQVRAVAHNDPQVHVFTNLVGVGNIEVNAFQTLSDVVVQKSVREGFGLVVSESMWKGTPVVAGRAGGIPLQMADGVGGVLVDSVEECAAAVVHLLEDREVARALGASGRARVRERFLVPRLLLNELLLMEALAEERPLAPRTDWHIGRDPVCGMALNGGAPVQLEVDGKTWDFCSAQCRSLFAETPERYTRNVAGGPEAQPQAT